MKAECTQLTCKVCGRPDKFDFYVPDELWQAIVPPSFQGNVVCLCCFDDFAKKKGINYSLQTLYFAGRMATFRFEVAWRGTNRGEGLKNKGKICRERLKPIIDRRDSYQEL